MTTFIRPTFSALVGALASAFVLTIGSAVVPFQAAASPQSSATAGYPVNKSYKVLVDPVNYGNKYIVEGTFVKSFSSRPVTLQYLSGGSWKSLKSAKIASTGRVTFTDSKAGRAYRIVANQWRNFAAFATLTVSAKTSWKLSMSDEFGGSKLNTSKWEIRQQDFFAWSRLCSASTTSATQVKGGQLRLSVKSIATSSARGKKIIANAKKELQKQAAATRSASEKATLLKRVKNPCPYGVFENGHVNMKKTFSKGIASARIKFPEQMGEHGAFWLQAPDVEIDIVEFFGKDSKGVKSILHKNTGSKNGVAYGDYVKYKTAKGKEYWKAYHVFSVEWDAKGYVFRIDGTETWRTTKWPSSAQHSLILSLLTSDWELNRLNKKKLPDTMFVDWVRVYQAK